VLTGRKKGAGQQDQRGKQTEEKLSLHGKPKTAGDVPEPTGTPQLLGKRRWGALQQEVVGKNQLGARPGGAKREGGTERRQKKGVETSPKEQLKSSCTGGRHATQDFKLE